MCGHAHSSRLCGSQPIRASGLRREARPSPFPPPSAGCRIQPISTPDTSERARPRPSHLLQHAPPLPPPKLTANQNFGISQRGLPLTLPTSFGTRLLPQRSRTQPISAPDTRERARPRPSRLLRHAPSTTSRPFASGVVVSKPSLPPRRCRFQNDASGQRRRGRPEVQARGLGALSAPRPHRTGGSKPGHPHCGGKVRAAGGRAWGRYREAAVPLFPQAAGVGVSPGGMDEVTAACGGDPGSPPLSVRRGQRCP